MLKQYFEAKRRKKLERQSRYIYATDTTINSLFRNDHIDAFIDMVMYG